MSRPCSWSVGFFSAISAMYYSRDSGKAEAVLPNAYFLNEWYKQIPCSAVFGVVVFRFRIGRIFGHSLHAGRSWIFQPHPRGRLRRIEGLKEP